MSKLREAAQAVIDRWESPNWVHDSIHTSELIFALREALREDALVCLSETHQQLGKQLGEQFGEQYELIGTISGTHGGRWTLTPEDKAAIWPDNTAVYARRVKR
jgi:UV DNA damage repair endonuclease